MAMAMARAGLAVGLMLLLLDSLSCSVVAMNVEISWSNLGPTPPWGGGKLVTFMGKVIHLGGRNRTIYNDDIAIYNETSQTWDMLQAPVDITGWHSSITNFFSFVYSGRLYVAGGSAGLSPNGADRVLTSSVISTADLRSWRSETQLRRRVAFGTAVVTASGDEWLVPQGCVHSSAEGCYYTADYESSSLGLVGQSSSGLPQTAFGYAAAINDTYDSVFIGGGQGSGSQTGWATRGDIYRRRRGEVGFTRLGTTPGGQISSTATTVGVLGGAFLFQNSGGIWLSLDGSTFTPVTAIGAEIPVGTMNAVWINGALYGTKNGVLYRGTFRCHSQSNMACIAQFPPPLTQSPTRSPTSSPTVQPTSTPTRTPSRGPSISSPTAQPVATPTQFPTQSPTISSPTFQPSPLPTNFPSQSPSISFPTAEPTSLPTAQPTVSTYPTAITPIADAIEEDSAIGISLLVICLIVLGACAALILVAVLIWRWRRKTRSQSAAFTDTTPTKPMFVQNGNFVKVQHNVTINPMHVRKAPAYEFASSSNSPEGSITYAEPFDPNTSQPRLSEYNQVAMMSMSSSSVEYEEPNQGDYAQLQPGFVAYASPNSTESAYSVVHDDMVYVVPTADIIQQVNKSNSNLCAYISGDNLKCCQKSTDDGRWCIHHKCPTCSGSKRSNHEHCGSCKSASRT